MGQSALQSNPAINLSGVSVPLQVDQTGNLLIGKGSASKLNLTASTVIKATPGRICKVIVNTAGSAPGSINDVATTGAAAAGNLIFNVPNTVGIYDVDFPAATGLVYVLGTGQVVSVSYD